MEPRRGLVPLRVQGRGRSDSAQRRNNALRCLRELRLAQPTRRLLSARDQVRRRCNKLVAEKV